MSLLPVLGDALSTFPRRLRPYNNVTPFTYQDGLTYLETLEELRGWLANGLIGHLNEEITKLIAEYDSATASLNAAMLAYTQAIAADREAFETSVAQDRAAFAALMAQRQDAFEVEVNAARARIESAVAGIEAAATRAEAAEASAEQWAATTEALQDEAVSNLVGNDDSLALAALGKRFPVRGEQMYNVMDFGAVGDGVADDTAAIQAAINLAGNDGIGRSGIVYVPKGIFIASTLTLRKGVTLQGANRDKSEIRAKNGSAAFALITIASGYTDQMWINDLTIRGNGNANQHGVYAYARGVANGSGGWGNGGMNRSQVIGFNGHAIWLRGGGGGIRALHQNQFLVFTHVDFIADKANANSNAARMSGKNGQVTYVNCQFNTSAGTAETSGTNLAIVQEQDDAGAFLSDANTYGSSFLNCSVEGRDRGVTIEGAFGVTFVGTFMEALAKAYKASAGCRGVTIIGTHWANAAHNAAGTGYMVEGQGTSLVSVYGGDVAGSVDATYVDAVTVSGVHNIYDAPSRSLTGQFGVDNNTVDIRHYTTVLLNGGSTVANIKSYHSVGATIYVKALGGAVTLTNAGNINLSGRATPTTIPGDHVATFVLMDLSGAWHLTAIS